jgi:phage-related minor tail protein
MDTPSAETIGGGLLVLGGIAAGAIKWWRDNKTAATRAEAEVNMLEELKQRNALLQTRLDKADETERDYFIAIGDIRALYRNQERLKRKLRHAGVPDSEVGTLIEETQTNFATLETPPKPP